MRSNTVFTQRLQLIYQYRYESQVPRPEHYLGKHNSNNTNTIGLDGEVLGTNNYA